MRDGVQPRDRLVQGAQQGLDAAPRAPCGSARHATSVPSSCSLRLRPLHPGDRPDSIALPRRQAPTLPVRKLDTAEPDRSDSVPFPYGSGTAHDQTHALHPLPAGRRFRGRRRAFRTRSARERSALHALRPRSRRPLSSVYSAALADLDGDGDADALSTSTTGAGVIAWHENLKRRRDQLARAHHHHRGRRALRRLCGGRGRRRRPRRPLRVAATTTRSPGTRTTATGPPSPRTPSRPPPTAPAGCLRRTWTATATPTSSPRPLIDDKIAWYENDGRQRDP